MRSLTIVQLFNIFSNFLFDNICETYTCIYSILPTSAESNLNQITNIKFETNPGCGQLNIFLISIFLINLINFTSTNN